MRYGDLGLETTPGFCLSGGSISMYALLLTACSLAPGGCDCSGPPCPCGAGCTCYMTTSVRTVNSFRFKLLPVPKKYRTINRRRVAPVAPRVAPMVVPNVLYVPSHSTYYLTPAPMMAPTMTPMMAPAFTPSWGGFGGFGSFGGYGGGFGSGGCGGGG